MLSKLFGISFGLGVLALVAAKGRGLGHSKHVHRMDPRDLDKWLDEAICILPPSLTTSQWHAAIDELEECVLPANTNIFGDRLRDPSHMPLLVQGIVNNVRRDRTGEKKSA